MNRLRASALVIGLLLLASSVAAAPQDNGPRDITKLKNGARLTLEEAAAIAADSPGLLAVNEGPRLARPIVVKNGQGQDVSSIGGATELRVIAKSTQKPGEGLGMTLCEEEPHAVKIHSLRELFEAWASYQTAWPKAAKGVIPFGHCLMGSCPLAINKSGQVLEFDGPSQKIIAPDFDSFMQRLEQEGLYWLAQ